MSDLAFRSATQLLKALRDGEVSSRELLDHYIERIESLNSVINAVVATDYDAARARADSADAARARGESWGVLHGLPMTIKDAFEVVGMPTTSGSPTLKDHHPASHAVSVQRLVDAGAIVFGKTNLPLWAGDLQTYNEVYGTTNNPWDTSRIAGGSSGGSAAALAAGLTALELGSDIGGSIRNPAHFNGVYGHKPSYGVVPVRGHIPGPPGSLSESDLGVAGPLARSAGDLGLALDVLAGPDVHEAVAWRIGLPASRAEQLGGFRVAAWLDDPRCPVDSEVRSCLEAAVETLRAAGVEVHTEARPDIDSEACFETYLQLLSSVTSAGFPAEALERIEAAVVGLDPEDHSVAANMVRGAVLRHRFWLSNHEKRQHLRARWAEFFRDFDVLLCPVVPTPAFPHDHSDINTRTIAIDGQPRPYFDQLFWAGLTTIAYLPSTATPIGRSSTGLPVGLQVVGPYLEDRTTIRFSELMGDVVGGFERPPDF